MHEDTACPFVHDERRVYAFLPSRGMFSSHSLNISHSLIFLSRRPGTSWTFLSTYGLDRTGCVSRRPSPCRDMYLCFIAIIPQRARSRPCVRIGTIARALDNLWPGWFAPFPLMSGNGPTIFSTIFQVVLFILANKIHSRLRRLSF